MHPRNPYRLPPDFRDLAKAYPPLEPCLVFHAESVSIDFKNKAAQRRLTEALLHRDFGMSLELPMNRLCPPVPNRLNYVLWIQDIVQNTLSLESKPRPIRGIDIGTGASAIYPLLSCKLNPNWSFVATDVDAFSLTTARSNVMKNDLVDRILVFETTTNAPIFAPLHDDLNASIDFTMCNPPFYSSHADVAASAETKEFEPNAVCTGADVEMITPGGESAFVRRMVQESVELGTRCRWYTSMLGKMLSLTDVISTLRERAIDNYGITEFVQGTTRRWAIAWSLDDVRLPDSVARITAPQLHSLMPPRNTLRQAFPAQVGHLHTATMLAERLSTVLALVDGARVVIQETAAEADAVAFTVFASKNTWSRGARRKNKHAHAGDNTSAAEASAPALVCTLRWIPPDTSTAQGSPVWFLECQWMKGKDRQLFEGFASHVGRKLSGFIVRN